MHESRMDDALTLPGKRPQEWFKDLAFTNIHIEIPDQPAQRPSGRIVNMRFVHHHVSVANALSPVFAIPAEALRTEQDKANLGDSARNFQYRGGHGLR